MDSDKKIISTLRTTIRKAFIDLFLLTVITLAILSALSFISNHNLIMLIQEFFRPLWKSFSNEQSSVSPFLDVIAKATPLWLSAVAFLLPMKAGYFNIGSEGQLLFSSFICIWTMDFSSRLGLPFVPTYFFSIIISVFFGISWAIVPFYVKKFSDVNEVITNLVLNFSAPIIIGFLLKIGDFASITAQGIMSKKIPMSLSLHRIWTDGTIMMTFCIVGLLIMVALDNWLWKLRGGLQLRAVGINRQASDFLGFKSQRIILTTVVIAGICSTFAGLNSTLAEGQFSLDGLKGIGFDGILVAILGGFRMSGIFFASLFFSLWRISAIGFQKEGLPYETYLIAQSIFLFVYLLKQRSKA